MHARYAARVFSSIVTLWHKHVEHARMVFLYRGTTNSSLVTGGAVIGSNVVGIGELGGK